MGKRGRGRGWIRQGEGGGLGGKTKRLVGGRGGWWVRWEGREVG